MKQSDFCSYAGGILSKYRNDNPQYHCKKNYCCGLCDRFYICLLDLLEEIKIHAEEQRKEHEGDSK